MVYREWPSHATDCCFCAIDMTVINWENRSHLEHPGVESAHHYVAYCEKLQLLSLKMFMKSAMKFLPVFQKWWRNRRKNILFNFSTSLKWHSTNPHIGDCSLTAASDRFTTATGLPLYSFLTHLKGRIMKRVLEKIYDQHEWFICVVNWCPWNFSWDSSPASPNNHAFYLYGIVGTLLGIAEKSTGLCRRNWYLAE